LIKDITRLGVDNGSGKYAVAYGALFDDPKVEQYYEALMGTLKAAKKRGIIDFKGQILLKGANDKEIITLLSDVGSTPPPAPAAAEPPAKAAAAPKPAAAAAAAAEKPAAAPVKKGFKTAAEMMIPPTGHTPEMSAKFEEINSKSADDQCQYFLKSFIFGLKDE
jgi:hypothetical protein